MTFYAIKQRVMRKVKRGFFALLNKKRNAIVDVTGVRLIPGNNGRDCMGNGEHSDMFGNIIECCCDECDYLLCCTGNSFSYSCMYCDNKECPRSYKLTNKK